MMRIRLSRMSNQFWDLVRAFFDVARVFEEVYRTYERKVLAYADSRGVDRRFLRLSGEEVAGLLDFDQLDALLNRELQALIAISRNIFRGAGSTDPFDRCCSQIFHEVSVLREEQYKVGTIAPGYQEEDEASYRSIIADAHAAFPRHVNRIRELIERARERLEVLLPHYRRDRVTLRSMYLYGDDVLEGFYPLGAEDGLDLLFAHDGGALGGLVAVARSFERAGFAGDAIVALERAVAFPDLQWGPDEQLERHRALKAEAGSRLAELKSKQRQSKPRRIRKKVTSPDAV